jgi:hypothetical protein
MQFAPKTEEELNPVFPFGIYEAEVFKAEDTVSKKSGKDMIKLTLKVYGPGEQTVIVNDYLMEAMGKKLRGFCEVAGILDIYESGMLQASDCFGRSVNVKLKVEQQDGFDPKNAVVDYLPTGAPIQPPPKQAPIGSLAIGGNSKAAAAAASERGDDNDVPF